MALKGILVQNFWKNRKKIIYVLIFLILGIGNISFSADNVLIPNNSIEAMDLLKKAQDFVDKKNWPQAISIYQKLLEQHSKNIVEVAPNLYYNVSYLTLQRMKSLPPEALKIYQNYTIALIQNLNFEPEKISELVPYLLTQEGKNILIGMVDTFLEKGQYTEALSCLQYLHSYSDDPTYLAGNLARLGFCYFALGNIEALLHLKNVCKKMNFGKFLLAGKEQELWEFFSQLESNNDQRITQLGLNNKWHTLGGNISRHSRIYQDIGTLKLSWQNSIVQPQRRAQSRFYNEDNYREIKSISPHYPILAEGMLFINNGHCIFVYDLFSGEEKWRFNGLVSILPSESHEQCIHSLTYSQGAIYANLEGATPTQQNESWSVYQIRKIITERRLVKLDAKTGRMIWKVGNTKEDDESFANKVSFMTPPIFWGKNLYVGAVELTGMFNSYLVAIEPETGKILHKTLLVSSQQELNMFGRPAREAVGSVISAGNGNLYFLTNLGVFACVHPNGDILWLYKYARIPVEVPQQSLYRTVYRDIGWMNGPVVLTGNSILFAPIDSLNLYCLDASTGMFKWQSPQNGKQSYLLGISQNKVVIGGNSIKLLDIETGKNVGNFSLMGDIVTGLGLFSGNYLYCPGTAGLYQFDLEKNTVEIKTNWPANARGKPGHLITSDAVVVYATIDSIIVYYDWEIIAGQMEKKVQIQASAADYLRLAGIYHQRIKQNKDFQEKAILMYIKALEKSNTDSPYYILAQQGLLQIYLQLAREAENIGNWDMAHSYYQKALPLVGLPEQAIAIWLQEYYFYRIKKDIPLQIQTLETLYKQYGQESYFFAEKTATAFVGLYAIEQLAQIYIENGQAENAINWLQKALFVYSHKQYLNTPVVKWAQQNIAIVIQKYGREVYQKYDNEAKQTYENIQKNSSNLPAQLQKIIEQYPNAQIVPIIYLELAKILFQEEKFKNVVIELRNLINDYPDQPEFIIAYYLLIESYEEIKNYTLAKDVLKQFNLKYEKETFIWQNEKIQVGNYVKTKLESPNYSKVQERKVYNLELGDLSTNLPIKYKLGDGTIYPTLRLLQTSGIVPTAYANRLFFQYGTRLICRDATNGNLLWETSGMGWLYGIGFVQEALIAWTTATIIRIDPDTGNKIWEDEVPESYITMQLGPNIIATVTRDFRRNLSKLWIRTPENKTVQWFAEIPGDPGNVLINSEITVLYTRSPANLFVFENTSGKILKQLTKTEVQDPEWQYYAVLLGDQYICILHQRKILECYELPSFKLLWKHDTDGVNIPNFSSLAFPMLVGNENYMLFLKNNQQIIALDLTNGEVKWKYQFSRDTNILRIIPEIDFAYCLEFKDGGQNFYNFDAQDGSLKWNIRIIEENPIMQLLITDRYILALASRFSIGYISRLLIFDKSTGARKLDHLVKNGDSSNDCAEMIFSGNLLWLVKNNTVWGIGK